MTIKTHKGEAETAPSYSSVVIGKDSSESADPTLRGWIAPCGFYGSIEARQELESLGVKVGDYNATKNEYVDCEVSQAVMDCLDPLWGKYVWGLNPITQPTASASAPTTTVPDESSVQHQTGSWWCCDADYPNHSASCSNASESSSPPDAGVVNEIEDENDLSGR